MKKINILILTISIISFFFTAEIFAQREIEWKGTAGWGVESQYNKNFNAETVETLSGQVTDVKIIEPAKWMSYGVQLTLKTENEQISAHLGPAWFIENQDIKFELNDKLEIKGSRINYEGNPVIIAVTVIKGDKRLKVRNKDGSPRWDASKH